MESAFVNVTAPLRVTRKSEKLESISSTAVGPRSSSRVAPRISCQLLRTPCELSRIPAALRWKSSRILRHLFDTLRWVVISTRSEERRVGKDGRGGVGRAQ